MQSILHLPKRKYYCNWLVYSGGACCSETPRVGDKTHTAHWSTRHVECVHVRQEATIDKGAEAETETERDANFADEDGSDGAIGGPDVA